MIHLIVYGSMLWSLDDPQVFINVHGSLILGTQVGDSSTALSRLLADPGLPQGAARHRFGLVTFLLPGSGHL